jgi:dTDP-L-rhamnose 4-epimerase
MMQVLITGGAGFIGTHLASRLAESGVAVTVFDSLHPQVHNGRGWPQELHSSVTKYVGDVCHRPDLDALFSVFEPDVVVHLAAETGTGQSLREATRHGHVNVVGTTTLLDALSCRTGRPSHLLLASSRAVYGEGYWRDGDGSVFAPPARSVEDLRAGVWTPRSPSGATPRSLPSVAATACPKPSNIYAATKLAQEHILEAWCSSFEVPLSVLRLQNVYGPGQSLTNSYTGVVSLFAKLAARGEVVPVYEDGAIVRDFVYIDDVVSAFVLAISRPPARRRLVDIGSGLPGTLLEVARIVAAISNAPDPLVTGQFRLGDVRSASCTIDEAARDLGYLPEFPLRRGLSALVPWVAGMIASIELK